VFTQLSAAFRHRWLVLQPALPLAACAVAALLLSACSAPDDDAARPGQTSTDSTDAPGSSPKSPASPPDGDAVLGGPSDSSLLLIGGQTGSDVTGEESASPCQIFRRTDYERAAQTPLGFSADDVIARLEPRPIRLRWAAGTPVEATLSFAPASIATLLERPAGQDCLAAVLRLEVGVTLESSEPGIESRWSSYVYAQSPDNLAGAGAAAQSELGPTLRMRSAPHEQLQLSFELREGLFAGWLSSAGVPAVTVVELIEVE
jgi:hypothetical protein